MANKLKNKQGVTILMALLFLLLAIVISCIVITAAITAVKTVDEDRSQQQAYLNVSSALELLKNEIVGTTIKTVTTETVDRQGNTIYWQAQEPAVVTEADSMRDIWAQIAPNMKHQNATTPPAPMTEPVTFFIETAMGAVNSQVEVTLMVSYVKVETVFTFQMVATLRNMDEAHPCEMTLTMSAGAQANTDTSSSTSGQTTTTTTTTATTYTWTAENVVVTRGKGESA